MSLMVLGVPHLAAGRLHSAFLRHRAFSGSFVSAWRSCASSLEQRFVFNQVLQDFRYFIHRRKSREGKLWTADAGDRKLGSIAVRLCQDGSQEPRIVLGEGDTKMHGIGDDLQKPRIELQKIVKNAVIEEEINFLYNNPRSLIAKTMGL